MSQYVQISFDEMRVFLKPEKGWREVDVAAEHVFDFTLPGWDGIVVRVYSSISKRSSQGRRVGSDAIRVCAVDTQRDKGLRKSKRVYRIEGWRNNLRKRVVDLIADLRIDFPK